MFVALKLIFVLLNLSFAGSEPNNKIELAEWQKALGQDSVQLVYSGPYNGNPASLFGHLFLKFINKNNLLSYSVAFMANTEDDSDVITIWKGLTGGYSAAFSINPYYINTALYNNSESRDLWEFPLKLNQEEISNLQNLIWQEQQGKPEAYYFFTRNCAYKLLELFDQIRPDLRLKSQVSLLIVPLDIVKIFAANALIDDNQIHQRKSIRKHLDENLRSFNSKQMASYRLAKADIAGVNTVDDANVLDTLIDHWKFRNYKKKLELSAKESQLFESTLLRRSQVSTNVILPSSSSNFSNTEVSPHLSHPTSWIRLGSEFNSLDKSLVPTFSFRLGVHSLLSSSKGLAGHSYMEYLGIDYGSKIRMIPFSIYSLDKFYWAEPQFSWKLFSQAENTNISAGHFFDENYKFTLEAGVGLSNQTYFILLGPTLYKDTKLATQEWNLIPQIELGYRYEISNAVFLLQHKHFLGYHSNNNSLNSTTFNITHKWTTNLEVIAGFEATLRQVANIGLQHYF